jgi:hypothetical protein
MLPRIVEYGRRNDPRISVNATFGVKRMAQETAERVEWTAQFPAGAPVAFAQNALQLAFEASIRAFMAYTQSALAWQRRFAEFASMRVGKDADLGRRLTEAKDTSEILRIQAEYMRTVADDCIQGAQRLMECGTEVSREILTPLKERAEEATREVKKRAEQGGEQKKAHIEATAA